MTSFKLMLLVGTALATTSGTALAQTAPAQQTPRPAPATAAPATTTAQPPSPAAAPQTPPATTPEAAPPAEEEEASELSDVVVTARPNDVRTSIGRHPWRLASRVAPR